MTKDRNKNIITKAYILYLFIISIIFLILFKAIYIQLAEGKKWKEKARQLTLQYKKIEAVRGNIYSSDGRLLATSIPIYEVRFDPNADAITNDFFYNNIDSLSYCLSNLFPEKSKIQYKNELIAARKNGARFFLIKKNVKYDELQKLKKFPILRNGRYKGGLIVIQKNKRIKPFRILAERTIGYERENVKPIGLEGAYDKILGGISGKRLMRKLSGNIWMPVNDENEIEPQNGYDIVSTIDVNIQDVAENALLEQLRKHDADHGTVVVMEVNTGEVKAIANLKRDKKGNYYEGYNYAIGESTEPGSTFKLASVIAVLEDGCYDIDDTINTGNGKCNYYDRTMYDSHKNGFGIITMKRAFEVSSNVGISRIVWKCFKNRPQDFVDRLYNMNLNKKLGIEIAGEGNPKIKSTKDKSWSGTTLPWMSIGYEVKLTPLQILTFYNAIANNGKMVKPIFVKEIKKNGVVLKKINPKIINPSICSMTTITKVRKLLEGVVQNGTAKNLKAAYYSIAGKTGTAQIANEKYGYEYESKVSYQASFVGYFPADNPKFSCIVVVNAPSKEVYYGNLVAGPIFKEVADKIYSMSLKIQENYAEIDSTNSTIIPSIKYGFTNDIKKVLSFFDIPYKNENNKGKWSVVLNKKDKVHILPRKVYENTVPNVIGMGAKDAVNLLESQGMSVLISGYGTVKKQSLKPGQKFHKGDVIKIILG